MSNHYEPALKFQTWEGIEKIATRKQNCIGKGGNHNIMAKDDFEKDLALYFSYGEKHYIRFISVQATIQNNIKKMLIHDYTSGPYTSANKALKDLPYYADYFSERKVGYVVSDSTDVAEAFHDRIEIKVLNQRMPSFYHPLRYPMQVVQLTDGNTIPLKVCVLWKERKRPIAKLNSVDLKNI